MASQKRKLLDEDDEPIIIRYPFQYNWDLGKVELMLENCKLEVRMLEDKIKSDLITIQGLTNQVENYKELLEIALRKSKEAKNIVKKKK